MTKLCACGREMKMVGLVIGSGKEAWRCEVCDYGKCPFCVDTLSIARELEQCRGNIQTAVDLLVESMSEKQSYDFNARRIAFVEAELRRRAKEG